MDVEKTSSALFPDGSVWVRTHPVTYLADWVDPWTTHAWHQLTFAAQGHLEVQTRDSRSLIPHGCALWVPAGTEHREEMRAPVAVRTLYFAPGAVDDAHTTCRTIGIQPLLRELIHHATSLGALDTHNEKHARLVMVLLDQLGDADDVPLSLPTPRDPRARRLARLIESDTGHSSSLRDLSRAAGASLRTLERCFLRDTGMSVGKWRRCRRMFHARRLLAGGSPVTQVAFEVGYRSVSAFCVAFKQQFGTSPSRSALA